MYVHFITYALYYVYFVCTYTLYYVYFISTYTLYVRILYVLGVMWLDDFYPDFELLSHMSVTAVTGFVFCEVRVELNVLEWDGCFLRQLRAEAKEKIEQHHVYVE
jgi:hypothetical protein